MYYVYFLQSLKNNDLYIGSSDDVEKRLKRHNAGGVRSTKDYRPWKLRGYETFSTRSDAMKREKELKSHQKKDELKTRFDIKA